MKRNVKTTLFDHSKAKVELLKRYVSRYINIIANDGITQKIRIYDLFCGEGVYTNGGHGSPVVILQAVKDLHYINKAKNKRIPPFSIHLNDIVPQKISNLKANVSQLSLYYPEFGDLHYSSNDYVNELSKLIEILPTLRNEKIFIFIDPYEYKHIKASQIKALMKSKNVEVLLWLPTQFMYRFSENGTPEALHDFIEELTLYKEWKSNDSVWKFVNQLREGFEAYIGNEYYVDHFSIEKDSSTIFCLYFFTSHIKGFEKILEVKWEIDSDYGKGWTYEQTGNLFSGYAVNEFEKRLLIYLKEKARTNAEVYNFTLNERYLTKHTTEIFVNLQGQSRLIVRKKDGSVPPKGAFYINYRAFKNEPDKVTIELR
jgi:three-Cys-motif partner protein